MFISDNIYTVHVNPEVTEPSERVVLVREGFNIWAFVFTILWTLTNRLWLLSALYLTLIVLLVKGGEVIELDDITRGVVQLGMQIWLGFAAHDAKRAALARRGYEEAGVVCAPSEPLAEQRYYDHRQAA